MKLQDDFYEYVKLNGFNLNRGKNIKAEHFIMEDLKDLTNFYETKQLDKTNLPIYTSIKSFMNYEEFTPDSVDKNLLQENNKLNDEKELLVEKCRKIGIDVENIKEQD